MARLNRHTERHLVARAGWLRAAVLGANDGIVSTASLIVGVAAASQHADIVLAGAAALVAGAMSMAAGEYVSVSSQADSEAADLARERQELGRDTVAEHEELARLYRERGLDRETAAKVAVQLMDKDALAAHAREELGISEFTTARPIQAALASALSFSVGAAGPLVIALLASKSLVAPLVSAGSLVILAILGLVGAKAGGAALLPATLRVTFWGALAMAITAGVGRLVGAAV